MPRGSGHSSTRTCAHGSTGLHVWWSLRTLSSQARLLEIWNTGPCDCTAASLELGINMFWMSAVRSLGIFWIVCTCLCTCASSRCSDRPAQGMEPVVLCGSVLALYLCGIASLHALQRSCTAAVKVQCSAVPSGRYFSCSAPVATSTVFAPGESRFTAH